MQNLKSMTRYALLLVPVLGLASLTACEEEETGGGGAAQVRTPKRPKGEKKAAPETSAQEEEQLSYSYNPIGKRDPFRSFISKDPVAPDNPVETPLQRYEIDQYNLVGIIWGNENPLAMVEDPDGVGHFLQKDTLIGRNWGKVVRITPSEVIVAEEYRDFEGKLIVNEIPLKLPVDENQ
ncbi:MAG: pilus assembly protein PilP [Myxococcota bacterium]